MHPQIDLMVHPEVIHPKVTLQAGLVGLLKILPEVTVLLAAHQMTLPEVEILLGHQRALPMVDLMAGQVASHQIHLKTHPHVSPVGNLLAVVEHLLGSLDFESADQLVLAGLEYWQEEFVALLLHLFRAWATRLRER